MKELLKNQYKNVILVICYIIVATVVYTVCADCIFDLWFIDVITAILMVALGITIGYFYIKSEEATRLKKLEEAKEKDSLENEPKEEIKEEDIKETEETINDSNVADNSIEEKENDKTINEAE